MFNQTKIFKGMTVMLFLFTFTYLFIRVFYNEPILDEIVTYFNYTYHGNYAGKTIFWDANNHLLNSFLSHLLYPFFHHHINWYRIPNLVAFILFFLGIKNLVSDLKTELLKFLALTTFCTIPFIIEYFAYCRGYGLSLGLFSWALVHLVKYLKNKEIKNLIFTYLFLILTISANLTFINTGFLISILLIIISSISFKTEKKKLLILQFSIHSLFYILLIPFIKYSFELKEHGALYIGGSNGLWANTGQPITTNIFNWAPNGILFLYIILFLAFLYRIFKLISSNSISTSLSNPIVIYSYLFFGNIIGIYCMSILLGVNYPQDRAAFYLIILFILILFYFLDLFKITKWLQYLFLYFPIILITKMSIHTSIVTPEDRISKTFYSKIKKNISPENSVSIHPLLNWNWIFYESLHKIKSSVATTYNSNSAVTDFIITKKRDLTNSEIIKNYTVITKDKYSTYIALKRKKPLLKTLKYDSKSVSLPKTKSEFITLIEYDSLQKFIGKNLQISVFGHLKTFDPINEIQLVIKKIDQKNQQNEYLIYSFDFNFQGTKINDDFLHHFILENITEEDKRIEISLWNIGLNELEITNSKLKLYAVEKP